MNPDGSPHARAHDDPSPASPVPPFLAGSGEAGRLIAARDWSGTSLGSKVREGWPEVAQFNDNVTRVGLAGGTLSYRDQELTLHRHGHPEQVWLDLDYSPVLDEGGTPAGVVAVVIETTERVRADRRLAEEAEQLRLVVEGAADYAIFTADRDRRVTSWSVGAQAAFGYAAEEVVGQPADILFTPEDRTAGHHGRREAGRGADAAAARLLPPFAAGAQAHRRERLGGGHAGASIPAPTKGTSLPVSRAACKLGNASSRSCNRCCGTATASSFSAN